MRGRPKRFTDCIDFLERRGLIQGAAHVVSGLGGFDRLLRARLLGNMDSRSRQTKCPIAQLRTMGIAAQLRGTFTQVLRRGAPLDRTTFATCDLTGIIRSKESY
jgi:hypothetical protein